MSKKRVTIDSANYQMTFYGILNHVGQFWTPIAFDSISAARLHIADYERLTRLPLPRHRIVPVRIRLEALSSPNETPGESSSGRPKTSDEGDKL